MANLQTLTERILDENRESNKINREESDETRDAFREAVTGVSRAIKDGQNENSLKEQEAARKEQEKEDNRHNTLVDTIKGTFSKISESISSIADSGSGMFGSLLSGAGIGATFVILKKKLAAFSAIFVKIAAIVGVIAAIGAVIYGAFQGLMHGIERIKEDGLSLESIAGTISSMIGGVIKVFRDISAWILDFFGFEKLASVVRELFNGDDILDFFYEGGKNVYNSIVGWVTDIFGKMANIDFTKLGRSILGGYVSINKWMLNLLETGINKIVNGIKGFFGFDGDFSIRELGIDILHGYVSYVDWMFNLLETGINKIVNGIRGFFGFDGDFSITKFLKDAGLSFLEGVSSFGKWIWDTVGSIVSSPINFIKDLFGRNDASDGRNRIGDMILGIPSMIWDSITNLLSDAIEAVRDKFGAAGRKLASFFGFGSNEESNEPRTRNDIEEEIRQAEERRTHARKEDTWQSRRDERKENDRIVRLRRELANIEEENTRAIEENSERLRENANAVDNELDHLRRTESSLEGRLADVNRNITALGSEATKHDQNSEAYSSIMGELERLARVKANTETDLSHTRDRMNQRESDNSSQITAPTEGLSQDEVLLYNDLKNSGFNREEIANILGNVQVESRGGAVIESMNYTPERAAQVFSNNRLGLDQSATRDDREVQARKLLDSGGGEALFNRVYSDIGGAEYRGRGHIQLTGKENYKRIGEMIGEDLVGNPDLMLDPEISSRATAAYFRDRKKSGANFSTIEGTTAAVAPSAGAEKMDARRAMSEDRLQAIRSHENRTSGLSKAADQHRKPPRDNTPAPGGNTNVAANVNNNTSVVHSEVQMDNVYDRDIFKNILLNESIFSV